MALFTPSLQISTDKLESIPFIELGKSYREYSEKVKNLLGWNCANHILEITSMYGDIKASITSNDQYLILYDNTRSHILESIMPDKATGKITPYDIAIIEQHCKNIAYGNVICCKCHTVIHRSMIAGGSFEGVYCKDCYTPNIAKACETAKHD